MEDEDQLEATAEQTTAGKAEVIAQIAYIGGKQAHESWREGVIEQNGPDFVRVKPLKSGDEDWAFSHADQLLNENGDLDPTGSNININVPYEELSDGWKKYQGEATAGTATIVYEAFESGSDLTETSTVESLSAKEHEKWMAENSWQSESTPALFVPYEELPEDEKVKDRDRIKAVIDLLQNIV